MADVKLKYTADSTQARKEMEKLRKENVKIREGLKQTAAASKKFAREAKKAYNETRTPQERFIQRKKQLNTLLEKGTLDWGTYRRAVHKAKDEMDRAGRAGKGALGGVSMGAMAAKASMTILIAAIAAARRAFTDFDTKKREAAQRERGGVSGLGKLAQLAVTQEKPKEAFAQYLDEARRFRAGGGAQTLAEAGDIVFAVRSAEQEKHLALLKRLRKSGMVEDVGGLSASVTALQTSMGKEKTGELPALISRTLAASKVAPATLDELLEAASKGAGSAAALGMSPDELLAAVAITSKAARSADVGGTVTARLLKTFDEYARMDERQARKRGITPDQLAKLKTGTLSERVTAIDEAGGLERPEFMDLAGEIRAVRAYRALVQNTEKLKQVTADVAAAPGRKLAEKGPELYKTDPRLAASVGAGVSRAEREESEAKFGTIENWTQAIKDDLEKRQRRAGYSELHIWTWRQLNEIETMGGDVGRAIFGGLPPKRWVWENLRFAEPETRQNILQANPEWRGEKGSPPGVDVERDLSRQANAQRQQQVALLGQIARSLPGSRSVGPAPFTEPVG